ncbi:MAG: hypothetical protein R3C39_14085 [Dehalococcoidia bacterium]
MWNVLAGVAALAAGGILCLYAIPAAVALWWRSSLLLKPLLTLNAFIGFALGVVIAGNFADRPTFAVGVALLIGGYFLDAGNGQLGGDSITYRLLYGREQSCRRQFVVSMLFTVGAVIFLVGSAVHRLR